MTTPFPSQRFKLRFLPAIPGTNSAAAAARAEQAAIDAAQAADVAVGATINKIDRFGDTMTGFLVLNADPTAALGAATKQYADTKVAKSGDAMTGFLTLSANPTNVMHAATKQYVDTVAVAPGTFQPLDTDLTSIANASVNGTFYYRRAAGNWQPVIIGSGLVFDTVTGDLETTAPPSGGDVNASDDPTPDQLAMWIGPTTIKGIDIGTGLELVTVGLTQSLTATGTVQISGSPVAGQLARWTNPTTIEGVTSSLGVTIADAAPASPSDGQLWWESDSGGLFLSYNDGNTTQWVAVNGQSATGAPIDSPTFTGDPKAPTPPPGDADTSISTTAFVAAAITAAKVVPTRQVITVSGTYTRPANLVWAEVECVGGGGGGGGATGSSGQIFCASGGGSGGYSRRILTAAQIGASQTVTVGSGGPGAGGGNGVAGTPTSFGSLCIANGGGGGILGSVAGVATAGTGASVVGAVGDVIAGGAPGTNGFYATSTTPAAIPAGIGGSSTFGGGGTGAGISGNTSIAGNPATNYGSGGGGAMAHNTTGSAAGGSGSAGICIVTEHYGS